MLAVIGNKGIKIFVKALKYLAKYSPEYIFEAKDNKLILKTCSSSQVSLAIVTFDDLFFIKYEVSANAEENVCRVSANVVLNVLKNPKAVASCTIKIDQKNDAIHFNIHKNNDYLVKNKISLLEYDEMDSFTIPKDLSEMIFHPSVLRRVLHSSNGIDELEFDFKNDAVNVKSYIDYPDEDCEAIRLNYTIDAGEFTLYNLKKEISVVSSCDDFIVFLNLAQSLNMEIYMKLSGPGRPVISELKSDLNFCFQLIQATLPPKSVSKRNIRNHSYKQVVMNYIEKRKVSFNETNRAEATEITDSAMIRAINPDIVFSTSNQLIQVDSEPSQPQEQQQIAATVASTSHINNSNRSINNGSSPPAYVSIPSTSARGSSKRKSTNEELSQINTTNSNKSNTSLKRQRTELDSTIVGNQSSIILSQQEMNEVNDIMSDIENFCKVPMEDDEMILPVNDSSNHYQNIQYDTDMRGIRDSEQVGENYVASTYSRERWPMENSFFGDTDDVVQQKDNDSMSSNDLCRQKSSKSHLQSLFGHIFKPRSRVSFGRVLVPGSDEEDEEED